MGFSRLSWVAMPKSIIFSLDKRNHEALQKEILREKNMPMMDLVDEFEVVLYEIVFKFTTK